MFAFDVNSLNALTRSRTLPTYWATGRDDDGNLITEISSTGSENLSFELNRFGDRRFYIESALNYKKIFGKHDVSGLLLFNQSDYRDASSRVETYTAAIPYRQRNVVAASIMVFKADILQKLTFHIQVQTILYLVRDMVSFPHSEQDG